MRSPNGLLIFREDFSVGETLNIEGAEGLTVCCGDFFG
jgi:hypothetical protein